MPRAARSTVFALLAAGSFMLAGGARADFEQDRQLYILKRLDLENAQAMLSFFEAKFAATTKAADTLRNHKNARRHAAGCDKAKPGGIGMCQRIETDYQTGIRSVASLREEVRSALLTQRALIERLRREFNEALAKYIAAVAAQAVTVPAADDAAAPKNSGEAAQPHAAPQPPISHSQAQDRR